MSADIWTIVPMRGIEHGKSRLATVLDAARRAALNRWLLARTLKVVGCWHGGLDQCVVVSPCQEALQLADSAGAVAVQETAHAGNLNRALDQGVAYAAAQSAGRILVLACDLPELTVAALRALTAAASAPLHMALAADKAGTGTNAMVVDARRVLEFRYGECSLERHRQWAVTHGLHVKVMTHPELGFDLDTPDDLAAWLHRGGDYLREPEWECA